MFNKKAIRYKNHFHRIAFLLIIIEVALLIGSKSYYFPFIIGQPLKFPRKG
jgi:hypothetical protein